MARDQDQLAPVVGERVVEREPAPCDAGQPIEPLLELAIQRRRASAACRSPAAGSATPATRPCNLVAEVLLLEVARGCAPASSRRRRARPTAWPARPAALCGRTTNGRRCCGPAPRSASTGSVRVANHAGARAEDDAGHERQAEGERRAPSATAACSIGRKRAVRTPAPAAAAPRRWRPPGPAMPPATASSDALDERLRDDLPRATRRSPAAPPSARGAPRARASSRLATFAQAMSSTSPQTPSRICRLRPYSSFITPTPAPAGTTVITCLRQRTDHVGHPVGRIAGVVLHPVAQHAGQARRHAVRWSRLAAIARSRAATLRPAAAAAMPSPLIERLLLQREPQPRADRRAGFRRRTQAGRRR